MKRVGLSDGRIAGLVLLGLAVGPSDNPTTRPSDALLTIGRVHYDGGGDWYANPSSLPNLLTALRTRTALPVAERERVVTLTGAELWEVPFIYMTGHGNVPCTPTTATGWTRRSAVRSPACFRTIPWLKCR